MTCTIITVDFRTHERTGRVEVTDFETRVHPSQLFDFEDDPQDAA